MLLCCRMVESLHRPRSVECRGHFKSQAFFYALALEFKKNRENTKANCDTAWVDASLESNRRRESDAPDCREGEHVVPNPNEKTEFNILTNWTMNAKAFPGTVHLIAAPSRLRSQCRKEREAHGSHEHEARLLKPST
jgi:hypothetical protein